MGKNAIKSTKTATMRYFRENWRGIWKGIFFGTESYIMRSAAVDWNAQTRNWDTIAALLVPRSLSAPYFPLLPHYNTVCFYLHRREKKPQTKHTAKLLRQHITKYCRAGSNFLSLLGTLNDDVFNRKWNFKWFNDLSYNSFIDQDP